jgi:hypothetical protein
LRQHRARANHATDATEDAARFRSHQCACTYILLIYPWLANRHLVAALGDSHLYFMIRIKAVTDIPLCLYSFHIRFLS